MHHVDFKKRKKFYLRIFSYSLMTVLTLLTTAALLYAALGYRISRDGEVVKSGLLLVKSSPVSADIYINGQNKDDPTDSRFVLPESTYNLELKQSGYRDWKKDIALQSSTVENIYYPILIPKTLKSKVQSSLTEPNVVSQSPNKKLVFLYTNNSPNPQITELNRSSSKSTALRLPETLLASDGSPGILKVVEWSIDSKHLLIEQTLGSSKRLLSLDVENPEKTLDITSLTGNSQIKSARYSADDAGGVYGISAGNLNLYNLDNGASKVLIKNIKSYESFDEDTFSFVRLNGDKNMLEAGIFKNNEVTIVHSIKNTSTKDTGLTTYSKYDDSFYFSVQLEGENRMLVYKNPLSEPVLDNQLPYSTVNLKDISSLNSSSNEQFVLAISGQKLAVYDFEHAEEYRIEAPEDTVVVSWLNSHHLLYRTKDNTTFISDFDGGNLFKLVKVDYGSLLFSDDLETSYRFMKVSSNKAQLESVDMLAARP